MYPCVCVVTLMLDNHVANIISSSWAFLWALWVFVDVPLKK